MKTHILLKSILLTVLITVAFPTFSTDLSTVKPASENSEQRALQLERRLEEIRAMDLHSLSRSEKKALRTEVRAIKKEAAALSGGVYLSVGAVIIILLLLILLL